MDRELLQDAIKDVFFAYWIKSGDTHLEISAWIKGVKKQFLGWGEPVPMSREIAREIDEYNEREVAGGY